MGRAGAAAWVVPPDLPDFGPDFGPDSELGPGGAAALGRRLIGMPIRRYSGAAPCSSW